MFLIYYIHLGTLMSFIVHLHLKKCGEHIEPVSDTCINTL